MSSLTNEEVLHLAKLANLDLEDDENTKLKSQLSEVISYFDELKKVPTDNVEPTTQTAGLTNVLSPDQIDSTRILSQEEALSTTEKIHNGAFVVPQTIDKEK